MFRRDISDIRRRLKFYGHLTRLKETKLTKKMFSYITKIKLLQNWLKNKKILMEAGINSAKRGELRPNIQGGPETNQ